MTDWSHRWPFESDRQYHPTRLLRPGYKQPEDQD